MRKLIILAAATAMSLSAPALAGAAEDFKALTEEYWAFVLRENPSFASQLGHREYDAQLGDASLAGQDRYVAETARVLQRLKAIPVAALSPADRTNYSIFKQGLEDTIAGNEFGQRMMLFTNRGGWHQNFAGLSEALTFRNKTDYENYLKRLAAYPAYNDQALEVSTRALNEGFVLPCEAMTGFPSTISGVIPADATQSRLYAPFRANRPASVSAADWADLQARARTAIEGPVRAAYAKHLNWYTTQYAPKCAKAVGVSALPNGKAFYNYRIRQMTTTTGRRRTSTRSAFRR
jgi:uncharacterized protein (DUF885 family)